MVNQQKRTTSGIPTWHPAIFLRFCFRRRFSICGCIGLFLVVVRNSHHLKLLVQIPNDQQDFPVVVVVQRKNSSNVGLDNEASTEQRSQQQSVDRLRLPKLDRPRRMLYVHVGKTGGTTLDRVLRSNCEMYQVAYGQKQEAKRCRQRLINGGSSHLSNSTLFTLHTSGERQMSTVMREQNITTFLWSVRNPMERVVSAFNMQHPRNAAVRGVTPGRNKLRREYRTRIRSEFYFKCFPTVEDLAIVLSRKNEKTMIQSIWHVDVHDYRGGNQTQERPLDCYQLGLSTIKGHGLQLTNDHLFYNIPRYASLTIDRYDHEIMVIRTEHLWHDTFTLNSLLAEDAGAATSTDLLFQQQQGMPSSAELHAETWGSEHNPVRSGLSKEGKAVVCCVLKHEMELFVNIVRRAVNLKTDEKEKYLASVYSDCGVSGNEDRLLRTCN